MPGHFSIPWLHSSCCTDLKQDSLPHPNSSPHPLPTSLLLRLTACTSASISDIIFWKNLSRTFHYPCCAECASSMFTCRVRTLLWILSLLAVVYLYFLPCSTLKIDNKYFYTSCSLCHSQTNIWHLVGDLLMLYELKWTWEDSLKWEATSSKN